MQTNTGAAPTFELYNPGAWKAFRKAFTDYVKHIAALEKEAPNDAEHKATIDKYTLENMTYGLRDYRCFRTLLKMNSAPKQKRCSNRF